MYRAMMTQNLRKYVICEDVIDHRIEIIGSETWSKNIKVFNDIVIKDGGSLTITCELHMQPKTRIIVERGGELNVEGGLLTGCGEYWRGIIVEGDASGNQLNSGKVSLTDEAIIENARNAISMNPTHISWPQLQDFWGGVVHAENAIIRDCRRAVEFMRYGQAGNKDVSTFINCSFENLKTGITIWANDGVNIENCQFNNIETYAVHPYDTEVIVHDGCTFDNMPEGIYIKSTFPTIFSSKIGQDNTSPNVFNTNIYGVYTEAVANGENLKIRNNNFFGGDHGVQLNGLTHSKVHSNDFLDQNFSGVTPQDQGFQPNDIFDNNISSSTIGSQASYNNSGLLYYENCFGFNGPSDIKVVDGNIFLEQGEEDDPADNCFSHGGTRAVDNSLGFDDVIYYCGSTNTNSCLYPKASLGVSETCSSGGQEPQNCGSNLSPGTIDTKRYTCFKDIKDVNSIKSKVEELEAYIKKVEEDRVYLGATNKTLLLARLKRCLKQLKKRYVVKIFEEDVNPNIENSKEQLISFLIERDDFEDEAMALGIMMSFGEYNRASQYLNSMNPLTEEHRDFIITEQINLDYLRNITTYSLSARDETILREIGEKVQPMSGYARALYEVLTGERIYLPYKVDGHVTPRSVTSDKNVAELRVWPNPADDTVYLNIDNDKHYDVSIYDLTGMMIYKQKNASKPTTINTQEWIEGMYIIKYNSGDDEIKTKKLIICK